ncbi:hypothetical protein [Kitasatospora viridis]|uniref:Uncharacterized protein n=1 Tax=Kitasatospora viridis TaxID=281105 RepID=A0A561TW72_9ACTN|nr:hypothetical protein [Kitasatospora viridis]TWF91366.1 hypothetical protein FHX73_12478 [Kitasatospora viridis]
MSDYYDLFLAVDLRSDLPESALHELRWLLGQAEAPPVLESADWESWGHPWQVFAGDSASHSFDGADTSRLVRSVDKPSLDGGAPWALTVRTCVHDDEFGVVMEVVEWLLRQAITQGWVGFLRYSGSDEVQHVVRHQSGFDVVDVREVRKQIRVSWS